MLECKFDGRVLSVIQCLLQWGELTLVLYVEASALPDQRERYLGGGFWLSLEVSHKDVQRRVSVLVQFVQVLRRLEVFDALEYPQNSICCFEVVQREGHVKSGAILHR